MLPAGGERIMSFASLFKPNAFALGRHPSFLQSNQQNLKSYTLGIPPGFGQEDRQENASAEETGKPQIAWQAGVDHAGWWICPAPMRGAGHLQRGREDFRRRCRHAACEVAPCLRARRSYGPQMPGGLAPRQLGRPQIFALVFLAITTSARR